MKRFVMGDIHGSHKALVQCLERSGFNKEEDQLIQLGDICDGWPEVAECVDELLTIKNLIAIKGNHDDWFHTFIKEAKHPDDWRQGGEGTLRSYCKRCACGYTQRYSGYTTGLHPSYLPPEHTKFFLSQKLYYRDKQDNLFVHAGFQRFKTLEEQEAYILFWDRKLFMDARSAHSVQLKLHYPEYFKNIYIGHTEVTNINGGDPVHVDKVINIDTGCGWAGKLTIMDIETQEFWQSDKSKELYPDELGRN